MKRAEYRVYLASREWALLKEQVRARSGGRCERCPDGAHDQTHHLTYERIGRERIEDLPGGLQRPAISFFRQSQTTIQPLDPIFQTSISV